jgi:hypothetical protein
MMLQRLFRTRRTPLPYMIRAHHPRELQSWALLGMAMGAVEGGVMGVLVRNAFFGHVSDAWLNTAIALVTGAPALANIMSFFWASASHGRDKIRFLITMQTAGMFCLLLIAFAPITSWGLGLAVAGSIGTRACWAGVSTVRTQVWRANYPRPIMAKMAGRMVTVMALIMGSVGIGLGFALTIKADAFRWAYPVLAFIGLIGAYRFRRIRVRRQKQLLAGENADASRALKRPNPMMMIELLRADPEFRRYMRLMMQFGSGNLMVLAPLILIINAHYSLTQLEQMLITSSIPLLMMTATMRIWSRLLDSGHVVHYRARHAWSFVAAFITWIAAIPLDMPALLWIGAAVYGFAQAGGVLGWNLGHHDFSSPERAAQYMGTHVTLTGIRGLIAPLVGVWGYQWLEMRAPGSGHWILVLPLLLATSGAIGFVRWSREMRRREAGKNV